MAISSAPTIERKTRAIDRHAYAPDASHFLLVPQDVLVPGDVDDVAALIARARAAGDTLTFRSGGTSLSGQSVTDRTLVDVRRNFRRIKVLDGGSRVRAGSGATVRQVNAALLRHGRRIGPDPASEVACTIGGVVADNSSGMSCGTIANSYSTLASLTVVLPGGFVLDTASPDAAAQLELHEPRLVAGLLELRDRLRGDTESVTTIRRLFAMKNTMGYGVNAFLDFDSPLDILTHLLVGSEGTLGFVADATFHTIPIHEHTATALAMFSSLDQAADVLPALVQTGAAALELMDASSLRVGAADPTAPRVIRDLEVDRHAAILIEFQAPDESALDELVQGGLAALAASGVAGTRFTTDATARAALWHVRKGLYAAVAGARPSGTTALLEDVVVPVERLTATCGGIQELLSRHGYPEGVIFGHAKDGNVHFLVTDDFSTDGALDRFAQFTNDLADLVIAAGGSLKAEHGTGRMMAPFVRRQYGDEIYAVMRAVKDLFDPTRTLNPGVIISDDDAIHLRNISWTPPIEIEADRCVECGYCEPACPSKDLTLTPRQRIVVRRAAERARLTGDAALETELSKDYGYDAVDTCAVDGMCQTACPVLINTGDLVKRLRKDRHAPLEAAVWNGAASRWSATTAAAAVALTAASHAPAPLLRGPNRLARAVMGKETLPLWSPELPAGGGRRARPDRTTSGAQAAYLPACVNAIFGPAEGPGVQTSFLELCDRAGITVSIVEGADRLCCGTPWSSKGLPKGRNDMQSLVVAAVIEATKDGELPLLCDASSCTEGLRAMIHEVLPHIRIADIVRFTAERLLPSLPKAERLGSVALHPTCSSTRMGLDADLVKIAQAVADDVAVPLNWGCCAFAGDRGMLHPELTQSATARQAEELNSREFDAHVSCNRTCELGMTRATGQKYRHVVELLADAHRR